MIISSLQHPEIRAEEVQCAAVRLLGSGVSAIERLGGGRNSRVYRLTGTDERFYVLKIYFRHPSDSRDRLWTEFNSLRFLWENRLYDIPQPLSVDWEQACALYEYIEGQKICALTEREIDIATNFLGRLKNLCSQERSQSFTPASEACFSGNALLANLQSRLSRLVDEAGSVPNLREFLDAELIPAFEDIVRWSRPRISFEYELTVSERTLSPSDFGFHNALQRDNGQLVFLDFEYFGWDDPAKTISDFLLHPAMSLSAELKRQYVAAMFDHFAEYPQLYKRVETIYPLYGIKWCLILLNEFLPEHRLRRQFAGGNNPEILRMEQLTKARRMLQSIRGEYEQFPYFDN